MSGRPFVSSLAIVVEERPSDRVAALFDAHHQRLYRLGRRLTPSADDALDLVQETFLRPPVRPRPCPPVLTERKPGWFVCRSTCVAINGGGPPCRSESGTPSPQGCSVYFVVDDADDLYYFHQSSGVEILEKPGDRQYGWRDYTVRDYSGYQLTFRHHPKHCAADGAVNL